MGEVCVGQPRCLPSNIALARLAYLHKGDEDGQRYGGIPVQAHIVLPDHRLQALRTREKIHSHHTEEIRVDEHEDYHLHDATGYRLGKVPVPAMRIGGRQLRAGGSTCRRIASNAPTHVTPYGKARCCW